MIIEAFLTLGTFGILVSSVGMITMPDPLCKMHAAAKASTLGISCYAIAYMLYSQSATSIVLGIATILFLFITIPVACHVLSSHYITQQGRETIAEEEGEEV